jgi:hypothetical protein
MFACYFRIVVLSLLAWI